MKRTIWTGGLASLAITAASVHGQPEGESGYVIDWVTIDAGGIASATGGGFEVTGTIGQIDAGVEMTPMPPVPGRAFSMVGGYWAAPDREDDCNDNGINDLQEFMDGAIADCNCNTIPDECDISNGTSFDSNPVPDAMPDECIRWIAGTGSWTDAPNWFPPVVPGGVPTADHFVTIAPVGIATVAGPLALQTGMVKLIVGAVAGGLDTLDVRNNLFVELSTAIQPTGRVRLVGQTMPSPVTGSISGGPVTIAAGGQLNTFGAGGLVRQVVADVDNSGTINVATGHTFDMGDPLDLEPFEFINRAGAQLVATSGANVKVHSLSVTQQGTITAQGFATIEFTEAALVNAGQMVIQGGSLIVPNGLLNLAGATITNGGGTAPLTIDGDVTNEGQIVFLPGVPFILNGTLTTRSVCQANGTANLTFNDVFMIGPGGEYTGGGSLAAVLDAAYVTVMCRGELRLEGTMALDVAGDLFLDGTPLPDSACDAEGGPTEPVLNLLVNAGLTVSGDFALIGCATVHHSSSTPVTLYGDFVNTATAVCSGSAVFDWDGSLVMAGSSQQTIEAAGADVGPAGGGLPGSFKIGTVDVSANANVRIRDMADNQADGASACDEALYVDQFILRAGSMLTLENCRVYAGQITNNGGTVNTIGCGALVPISGLDLADFCNFQACWYGQPPCTPGTPCSAFDYNASGTINLADFALFQQAFGL